MPDAKEGGEKKGSKMLIVSSSKGVKRKARLGIFSSTGWALTGRKKRACGQKSGC